MTQELNCNKVKKKKILPNIATGPTPQWLLKLIEPVMKHYVADTLLFQSLPA